MSVLSHRSFRFLWFGQICSQFAVNTLLFVLALHIYQTTTSNTAVAGLFLAHSIPAVLFGLVAGTLVDRLDKRKVIIVCDVLRGGFALSLLFLSQHVGIMYVVTFLNSCITQLYVPSAAPLIPILLPKKLLVSANSMFAFTFYSSIAIGSVLAGPFLRILGPHRFFITIALLYWSSSFFSYHISSQQTGTVGFRYLIGLHLPYLLSRIWQRLKDGVHYVSRSSGLFEGILLLTGTQIVLAILGTLGPGFADTVLGMDVRDASLFLVGPVVLGIVLGALWVGNIGYRYTKKSLITVGVTSVGVMLVSIFFFARTLGVYSVVLFFGLGVANSLLDVPANAILQEETQGDMRGRVYGILAAFVGGVGLLPVIIGGALADTIGVQNVIGLMGFFIISYALFRLRYNRISS